MNRPTHLSLLAAVSLVVAFSGCGENTSYGPCPDDGDAVAEPYIQLLYPEPSSTGVATVASVLIYNAPSSYPIEIAATTEPVVVLLPTALPSPLPSPIASPLNLSSGDRAVALPALKSGTTYTISARISAACGPSRTEDVGIGSFTTR